MDNLTNAERSLLMAGVRAKGNRSTERAVEVILRSKKLYGWRKHAAGVLGTPDFYFQQAKLAVFVDGCFWHACPTCGRIPKTNVAFWAAKIDSNRRRDNRVRSQLRASGYHVVRIWEHEVKTAAWVHRIRRIIERQPSLASGCEASRLERDGHRSTCVADCRNR